MKKIFTILILLFAQVCHGAPLELTLRANKVCAIGQHLKVDFVFRNTSNDVLRFLPNPEVYYPDTISLERCDGRGKVDELELVERSMDYEAWAGDVATIPPGGSNVWHLDVNFVRHLPADWKPYLTPEWQRERAEMPFLVFLGASALRLPGFGQYSVVGKYKFEPKHPVVEHINDRSRLWFGQLESKPIIVNFTN